MAALPTFTIERDEAADPTCRKCLLVMAEPGCSNHYKAGRATHTLVGAGKSWRLCTNHAAAACHTMGIPHPTFTPHLIKAQ